MKYLHLFLFSFLMLAVLPSCSDSKDEPINSVFAFSSSDKNISITNSGTNAVVNVGAPYNEITITLLGTFIHTDIECSANWIKATVTDKELKLIINGNYGDKPRSANIAIKANDQAEIVLANLAVNQSSPTTEDLDAWQTADILYIVESEGGINEIPTQGELEKGKWYRVYSDNSVFFRIAYRQEPQTPINVGDEVAINFMICTIDDMYYFQDWWLHNFYNNKDRNQLYTVSTNPPQSALDEFGKGILDVVNKAPIRFGDDIDIIQTSYAGVPQFADDHYAYVYVVQYNKPKTANTNSAPMLSPRLR